MTSIEVSYWKDWDAGDDERAGKWVSTRKISGIMFNSSDSIVGNLRINRGHDDEQRDYVRNEILLGNEVIGLRCSTDFKEIRNLSFVLWSGPIRHKDINE